MRRLVAILVGVLAGASVSAQALSTPAELKAWEPWVLHGEEFRRCPLAPNAAGADAASFACLWPGRLHIAVTATGGEFSQRWQVYAESWVALPGDDAHWPERVIVDGTPASVVVHDGSPHVRLATGSHQVSGRFLWTRRPESLRVPAATALVALSIDGAAVSPVELRNDRLWLGAVRTVAAPRALQVQVYRLLQDAMPPQLITHVQLKVSGDAREEILGRVLPEGFSPIAVDGPLPMRFEPDGRLRVQVRSGEHVLAIAARGPAELGSIRLPPAGGPWAQEEIWSYASDDRLRITAIEGPALIDPVQAGVPEMWRGSPAYRMTADAVLAIAERTRGLHEADANRLSLSRELWLDFDHGGFLAVDSISGEMQQGWRLDMAEPYRLLSARWGEESLLVTDGDSSRTGVEVRSPQLDVTALARIEGAGSHPTTGWAARFESMRATLYVPPGHRLLGALGVDAAPGSWISEWRLLDFFLLMLITVAAYRLLGVAGAACALGGLALTYHEPLAPSWLWVNALLAVAIARLAPEGRVRSWAGAYRLAALALLALALLAFALQQYRLAAHPQLDVGYMEAGAPLSAITQGRAADAAAAAGEVALMMDKAAPSAPAFAPPRVNLEQRFEPKALERYAPDALVQTGPGVPAWRYRTYQLMWSGPVTAEQSSRLLILSPAWLSLWRVTGIVLSALLLVGLVRLAYGLPWNWPRFPRSAAAPVLALALALWASAPTPAHAAPEAEVLNELKARLTKPPVCAPRCTEIAIARIAVAGDRLEAQLEAHAQASAAIGLPHAGPSWVIERITIDDREVDLLARTPEQQRRLPLEPGVHRVRLAGRIVQADELTIEFAQQPHRVEVESEEWDSSGANEGRLLNDALQLTRRPSARTSQATLTPQRFPPFVRVHRYVRLNLDWTMTTEVERISPREGAFTMRVPLLPGESVLTHGLDVRDGEVLVSMPAGESAAVWESSLARVDRLQWTAAAERPWVEHWSVAVSPMWHAELAGTPALRPNEDRLDVWRHEFLPRPGESLEIAVTRPRASRGETLAVDSASLFTDVGRRASSTTFAFAYRSSQGGRHDVQMPPAARVDSIRIDGAPVSLRPVEGRLPLTLQPGEHDVAIEFTTDAGAGLISRTPHIDLGAEASNLRTRMQLGADRWILFAWGPGVGPAILYWSELALFVVIAALLGRIHGTPMRTRDWVFLGLGLSTFSWWVLAAFGIWLFVLASRERWRIESRRWFNTAQIALALLSLAALALLVSAIPFGLLASPDMGIRSDVDGLAWFIDRAPPELPQAGVLSVPLWVYKAVMLAWALWLSSALLRWLPWAWRQFSIQGGWRRKVAAPALG